MSFWEIREPFGSDYKHVHLNGRIEHPFQLPEPWCEIYGQSVSSYFDVVLPYECPSRFRKRRSLIDEDMEMSLKDSLKLTKEIASDLPRSEGNLRELTPGAYLQPGFLDVPSMPSTDFLWSNLRSGPSCMIVNERVRDALKKLPLRDVDFYPVTMRKVGKRTAKSAPRVPASGEPEDMLRRIGSVIKASNVARYFQVLVFAQAEYPPGAEPGAVCRTCGQETDPDWNAKAAAWKRLTTEVVRSISKGFHIFRIPERGAVYVSDEFKAVVEALRPANVEFRAFPSPAKGVAAKRPRKR